MATFVGDQPEAPTGKRWGSLGRMAFPPRAADLAKKSKCKQRYPRGFGNDSQSVVGTTADQRDEIDDVVKVVTAVQVDIAFNNR